MKKPKKPIKPSNTDNPDSPYWSWGYTNTLVGNKQDFLDIGRIMQAHNDIVMELEQALDSETTRREKLSLGVSGIMNDRQGEINALEQRIQNQAGVITEMQVERDRLEEEIRELYHWKESAMGVSPDFQQIGRVLGLRLGESVHDKILPAIYRYEQEIKRLKEIITDAANALSESRR